MALSFARRYARRNYKRIGRAALGMAVRRYRRTYTTKTGYLRGTRGRSGLRRLRISKTPRGSKRAWAKATGTMPQEVPAARTPIKKTRFHNELGIPVNKSMGSRRNRADWGPTTTDQDKQRHVIPLVDIPWSSEETQLNARASALVNVTGVKLRFWFAIKAQLQEASNIYDRPLQIRWALVNPRDNTGAVTDITAGDGFFVSDNPIQSDGANFPTTGNCFKYMNRPINKRRYGVMQEGTFTLWKDPASNNSRASLHGRKLLSLWIPINKQMRFDSNTTATGAEYPTTNVFFVWWYCVQGDTLTSKAFAAGNQPLDVLGETITYFNNPRNVF